MGVQRHKLSPALWRAAWVNSAVMSALEAAAAVEDMSVDADAACLDEPDPMVVARAEQTLDGDAGEPAFARPPFALPILAQGSALLACHASPSHPSLAGARAQESSRMWATTRPRRAFYRYDFTARAGLGRCSSTRARWLRAAPAERGRKNFKVAARLDARLCCPPSSFEVRGAAWSCTGLAAVSLTERARVRRACHRSPSAGPHAAGPGYRAQARAPDPSPHV